VQQNQFLYRKRFCCIAAAFPAQQKVLLCSKINSCTGNDFAVLQRQFQRSKRFCCAAKSIPVQETILQCSSGDSSAAKRFAVQQRHFPDSKQRRHDRPATPDFEVTTTYMLCTTTLMLCSSPVSHASKFVSYSLLRIGTRMIEWHGPCAISRRSLGRKSRVEPAERRTYDTANTDQSITGFQEDIGR
jgi:hypothetical protein